LFREVILDNTPLERFYRITVTENIWKFLSIGKEDLVECVLNYEEIYAGEVLGGGGSFE
jgi:hypothetical protein